MIRRISVSVYTRRRLRNTAVRGANNGPRDRPITTGLSDGHGAGAQAGTRGQADGIARLAPSRHPRPTAERRRAHRRGNTTWVDFMYIRR